MPWVKNWEIVIDSNKPQPAVFLIIVAALSRDDAMMQLVIPQHETKVAGQNETRDQDYGSGVTTERK